MTELYFDEWIDGFGEHRWEYHFKTDEGWFIMATRFELYDGSYKLYHYLGDMEFEYTERLI